MTRESSIPSLPDGRVDGSRPCIVSESLLVLSLFWIVIELSIEWWANSYSSQDRHRRHFTLFLPHLSSGQKPFSSALVGIAFPSVVWYVLPHHLPLECSITSQLTLPDPKIFARDSDSTFFVGFTTSPPSRTLTAELQAKAEITVALSCQYWFDSSQEVATNATGKTTKWKQPPASPLMRILNTTVGSGSKFGGIRTASATEGGSGLLNRANSIVGPLPLQDLIETRQLWATNKRGFPNRPRRKPAPAGLDNRQPPLGPGPHGLWKHQIQFGQDLMPSMDIPGMTVKVGKPQPPL